MGTTAGFIRLDRGWEHRVILSFEQPMLSSYGGKYDCQSWIIVYQIIGGRFYANSYKEKLTEFSGPT